MPNRRAPLEGGIVEIFVTRFLSEHFPILADSRVGTGTFPRHLAGLAPPALHFVTGRLPPAACQCATFPAPGKARAKTKVAVAARSAKEKNVSLPSESIE